MPEVHSFPEGLLWGATMGSHQTEGNNIASGWWALENAPGSPIAERSGDAADSACTRLGSHVPARRAPVQALDGG